MAEEEKPVWKAAVPEELTFPKTYDKCPVCGSKRRIVNGVMDEQKAKGLASPDLKSAMMMAQNPIVDPSRIALSIPVLLPLIDACYDCGALYVIEVNKVMGTPQMGPPPMRPGGNTHGPQGFSLQ